MSKLGTYVPAMAMLGLLGGWPALAQGATLEVCSMAAVDPAQACSSPVDTPAGGMVIARWSGAAGSSEEEICLYTDAGGRVDGRDTGGQTTGQMFFPLPIDAPNVLTEGSYHLRLGTGACPDPSTPNSLTIATSSSFNVTPSEDLQDGNGNPLFPEAEEYSVGTQPKALALADLNNDDAVEVVTANDADISVLLNNGNGDFTTAVDYPSGGAPSAVASTDVDGDGDRDLVVTNYLADAPADTLTLCVLDNLGAGSFSHSAPDPAQCYPAGARLEALAVGDFSDPADGYSDVAAVNKTWATKNLQVLLNNQDGSFQSPRQHGTGGRDPVDVTTGDVNRDGLLDLITANAYPTTQNSIAIAVLLGLERVDPPGPEQAIFGAPAPYKLISKPRAVATEDLDGDGFLDVVATTTVSDKSFSTISVFWGEADGTLESPVLFKTASDVAAIAIGDLDGNGELDVAAANETNGTVRVLRNHGNRHLQMVNPFAAGDGSADVAIADVNGDGLEDLVFANSVGNNVTVKKQAEVEVGAFECDDAALVLLHFDDDDNLLREECHDRDGTPAGTISNEPGRFGQAFVSTAANGVIIKKEGALQPGLGSLTMEAWIKPEAQQQENNHAYIISGGWGHNRYATLSIFDHNNLVTTFSSEREPDPPETVSIGLASVDVGEILHDGRWHHVKAILDRGDGNKIKIFLDGIDVRSQEKTFPLVSIDGYDGKFGFAVGHLTPWDARNGREKGFSGLIDEVRISNSARTQ